MTKIVQINDKSANVWDTEFEIECPKCNSIVYKNEDATKYLGSNDSRLKCSNCKADAQLWSDYFLVQPNQDAYPGVDKGDRINAGIQCSKNCGWIGIFNINDDKCFVCNKCNTKIGSVRYAHSLKDWWKERIELKKNLPFQNRLWDYVNQNPLKAGVIVFFTMIAILASLPTIPKDPIIKEKEASEQSDRSMWISRCIKWADSNDTCAIAANVRQCVDIKMGEAEALMASINCQGSEPQWGFIGKR